MQHGSALLRDYLKRKDERLREFARRAGIVPSQVCRFRQGKMPSLPDAFRIQDATRKAVPARSWINGNGK